MKKGILAVAAVLIVGAVLVLYFTNRNKNSGSDTTGSTSSQMTGAAADGQNSGSTTAAVTNKVTIENMAFTPAAITVKKGTTVTWTNQDDVAHTVTATDGQAGPKSSSLAKGQSYSFTFNTAGTFAYDCSIHTSMTGTVTVTE